MIYIIVYLPCVSKGLNVNSKTIKAFEPLLLFHVHCKASYVAYRMGGRLPLCVNDDIDSAGEVRFTNNNEQEALADSSL